MLHDSDGMSQHHKPSIEWVTVGMLGICYGLWAFCGLFLFQISPFAALAIMAVTVALHSSLQHEIMHGHPTRNGLINELLVALPLGLAYPYRRYKTMHMKHHNDERLTDPYDDPESYYRAEGDWQQMSAAMKHILRANNTLVGRVLLGPALGMIGFFTSEAKLAAKDASIRKAWALHFLGLLPVFVIVQFGFHIPFWIYALGPAYFGLSLIGVRTYCEHQWFERPDGRTIIVERSLLAVLFLYNNLHIVHHKLPMVAWYHLPKLYAERKAEWQDINGGYVYRNYWQIIKSYAFRVKEPNVHPVLRRANQASPTREKVTS